MFITIEQRGKTFHKNTWFEIRPQLVPGETIIYQGTV